MAQLGAEARVGAQRGGRARQHADEVRQLPAAAQRAACRTAASPPARSPRRGCGTGSSGSSSGVFSRGLRGQTRRSDASFPTMCNTCNTAKDLSRSESDVKLRFELVLGVAAAGGGDEGQQQAERERPEGDAVRPGGERGGEPAVARGRRTQAGARRLVAARDGRSGAAGSPRRSRISTVRRGADARARAVATGSANASSASQIGAGRRARGVRSSARRRGGRSARRRRREAPRTRAAARARARAVCASAGARPRARTALGACAARPRGARPRRPGGARPPHGDALRRPTRSGPLPAT